MTRVSTVEAREQFSETVNRAAYGQERIILTRRGKELVALVPIEDLELIEESEDRLDGEEARIAREEARREGTVPWEQAKKELGL